MSSAHTRDQMNGQGAQQAMFVCDNDLVVVTEVALKLGGKEVPVATRTRSTSRSSSGRTPPLSLLWRES